MNKVTCHIKIGWQIQLAVYRSWKMQLKIPVARLVHSSAAFGPHFTGYEIFGVSPRNYIRSDLKFVTSGMIGRSLNQVS